MYKLATAVVGLVLAAVVSIAVVGVASVFAAPVVARTIVQTRFLPAVRRSHGPTDANGEHSR
jgi:hypothetical protein